MDDDPPKLSLVTETANTSGKPPTRTPMPAERETLNPAPDKDYSRETPPPKAIKTTPEIENE